MNGADMGDPARPIAVMVVDDHMTFVDDLQHLLRAESGIEVVGVTGSAEAALTVADRVRPSVVVIGHALPGIDGVEGAKRLLAANPRLHVILLTDSADDDVAYEAMLAGCSGSVEKSRVVEELAPGIRLAAKGKVLFPAEQLTRLLSRTAPSRPAATASLTPRETEVLARMAAGESNKEIALALGVRLNTVRNHVHHILHKLDAHSKLHAVAIATRQGRLSAQAGSMAAAQLLRRPPRETSN